MKGLVCGTSGNYHVLRAKHTFNWVWLLKMLHDWSGLFLSSGDLWLLHRFALAKLRQSVKHLLFLSYSTFSIFETSPIWICFFDLNWWVVLFLINDFGCLVDRIFANDGEKPDNSVHRICRETFQILEGVAIKNFLPGLGTVQEWLGLINPTFGRLRLLAFQRTWWSSLLKLFQDWAVLLKLCDWLNIPENHFFLDGNIQND